MNKIKFKKNVIKVKNKKGQQLAESKIDFANRELSGCLLKTDFKRKRSGFEVFIYGEEYITLKEYLSMPLSKKFFALLLKNIIDNLKVLRGKLYDYHNILLDINYVMINSSHRKVFFAYIPIEPFDSGCSLEQFLLSIANELKTEQNEDASFLDEYRRILSENRSFSLFDLEEYVRVLQSGLHNVNASQTVCPECNTAVTANSSYCPQCGRNLRDSGDGSSRGVIIPESGGGYQQDSKIISGVVLRRKITNEKIEVNRKMFVIGRNGDSCDYCISDHSVSGNHAFIICKPSGAFVIKDNNSTNGTFINNVKLLPGREMELTNGCEIRLANIAFVVSLG